MLDAQKSEFFDLMCATVEVYGQPKLSKDAIRIWWAALQHFDIAEVRQALDEHIRKSRFTPRPADILDILDKIHPDGRPGVEEAWAMIPRDESESAVMTEEMSMALRAAQPLLNECDQVAARVAFKQAYERLVDTAKRLGEPVRWFPSLGTDKESRDRVLAEAVRLGRLKADHALALLPPEKAEPMLMAAGMGQMALEYKPSPDFNERIQALKLIVGGKK